ncbi:helix-turn-helix domain-containing protein [Roseovarius sp. MMSF_3281]|uniref:helix-turn-helix domain-containing protein n=1 Tax=Roseovarius sp. MMSF_3281 TaxID=3046694 RepID=UPI00273EE341|nr:helix-turn-helix domain-containing protein [Roseovarius sp. MMSF_3281]
MSAARERVTHGRIIEQENWRGMRWGWMESVRRDTSLSATARLVADMLALDFVNVRTMRCDPSHGEIAAILGSSKDTAKRAVNDLIKAGWLVRDAGIGRGNKSSYGFVSRAQVVPIKGGKNAPPKGGNGAPLSASQKGANLPGKGGKNASGHNIAKPWKNHGAGAGADTRAGVGAREGRVSDNPMVQRDAQRAVDNFRAGQIGAFDEVQPWIWEHVLGAGLLTDEEREAVAARMAEKGGK